MVNRIFIDAATDHRCKADVVLRDGSSAQCGRKLTTGDLCTQHAKIAERSHADTAAPTANLRPTIAVIAADHKQLEGDHGMPETSAGIDGCKYIYAPGGQAGEYAPLAANPYRGCGHGCAYCYVPAVIKMSRQEFDAGALPRTGFMNGLLKDAKKYQAAASHEQVMLSFTSDPYHRGDTALTRETLIVLRDHGLGFCTLTKGGTRALRDIDLFRPNRDAFASTLTSLDDAFSLKWERGAALPADRLSALQSFHAKGIFTWVSLEPTLDVESSLRIVRETHKYVELFKIGRVNYLPMTKTTDWQDYTVRMIDLCQQLGAAHYIKKDLQPFLPPNYQNPLRVAQHHGSESDGLQ